MESIDPESPRSRDPRQYGLFSDERPSDGLRRVALGRVEDALEQLGRSGDGEGSDAGGPSDAGEVATRVHEARKDLKKARAVLRLVRSEIGGDVYGAESRRLRDAGRLLSAARDAEVKLKTLRSLRERYPGDFPPRGTQRLEAALGAERDQLEGTLRDGGARLRSAYAAIEAARGPIASLALEAEGWELVGSGLEHAYARGRRLFEVAMTEPSAHNVHEWRKRAKDLWYHLRILECIWPPMLGEMGKQAHELGDLLGDHNDLAVLVEDAASREGVISVPMAGRLRGLGERRQAELLARATAVGERIYAERPRAFRRRMRAYWRIWRAETR